MHRAIPYLTAGIVMVILGGIVTFLLLVQDFGYGDCLEIKGEWDQVQNEFMDLKGDCAKEIRTHRILKILVIPAIPAFWVMSIIPKVKNSRKWEVKV